MAKVFLDTNCFIDAIHRHPEKQILDKLKDNTIFVSTLSFHIYCYSYKIKIPNKRLLAQKEKFQLIDFSDEILDRALNGPTNDLEDNIQFQSAAEAECDFFVTSERKLLKMKFFGKAQIVSELNPL